MSEVAHDRIGRRIRWYRDQRRLTQDALARKLGFNDRQTLSDIEAGKRRIAPGEFAAIAKALGIGVEELVDPFRLVGEGRFNFRVDDVADPIVDEFAEQAGRWIATYRELGRQSGIAPSCFGQKLELTKESSFEDAAASAEALRTRWKLGDVPAESLEAAMERELGTLVLYIDAPVGVSGAASQLPGLQTIMVNRREPASRRAFDLAHELFHVLTWDAMPPERIEGREPSKTKGNRVEQLANNFAASLLMPEPVVRTAWKRRGETHLRVWTITTAHSLRVSPKAMQWRLVNLDLNSKSQMVDVDGESAEPGASPPPLFSEAFVTRVRDAVEAGHLSLRRAASLLGLSLSAFAEVCRSYGLSLSYDA